MTDEDIEQAEAKRKRLAAEANLKTKMTSIGQAIKEKVMGLRYGREVAAKRPEPRPNSPIFDGRRGVMGVHYWLQRRFFLAFNSYKTNVSIMWVDDEGSCRDLHHIPYDDGSYGSHDWHEYENPKGYVYAIRCPRSLTADQVNRLERDDPPGHAVNRLRDTKSGIIRREHNLDTVKQEEME